MKGDKRNPHGISYVSAEVPTRICVYCGEAATTADHVPPLAQAKRWGADHFDELGVAMLLYPACWECNITLASITSYDMQERSAYLFDRYSAKYGRILQSPSWTDEELKELGGALSVMIRRDERIRREITRRLAFLTGELREAA